MRSHSRKKFGTMAMHLVTRRAVKQSDFYVSKMTDELTNLNWLCSITTADSEIFGKKLNKLLMPPSTTQIRSISHKKSSSSSFRLVNGYCKSNNGTSKQNQPSFFSRPPCSYSCLIAMALKASTTGCLPVHEIYRFVEQEYPFYKTAPEGWKNSIRHNLSMNQNFIKIQRPDGFQTKKGYYWAANPNRQHILDIEMDRALKAMGRRLVECFNNSTAGKLCGIYSQIYPAESKEDVDCSQFCSNSISPPLSPHVPDTLDEQTKLHVGQLNKIAGIRTPERNFPFMTIFESSQDTKDISNDTLLADFLGGLLPNNGGRNKQKKCFHFDYYHSYHVTSTVEKNITTISGTVCTNAASNDDDTEIIPSYIRPYYKILDEEFKSELADSLEDDTSSVAGFDYDIKDIDDVLDCSMEAIDPSLDEKDSSLASNDSFITQESLNEMEGILIDMTNESSATDDNSDIERDMAELDMDAICELHNEITIAQLPTISSTEEALEYLTGDINSKTPLPSLTITDPSWEIPTACNNYSCILVDSDAQDLNFEAVTELAYLNNYN